MTNKQYSIKVTLTDEDIYQLQSGDLYFNWSYETEEDKTVTVNIILDKEVIGG